MGNIKNRVLELQFKLITLASAHCENLVPAIKQNVRLLQNGLPFFIYVGDTDSLAQVAGSQFPTCFGPKGCYPLNPSSVYHIVPGDATKVVHQQDADALSILRIETENLTDRMVMIIPNIAWLPHLDVLESADVILIAKSSKLTDDEMQHLRPINLPMIYVGTDLNRRLLRETLTKQEIEYFDDADNSELKRHIAKRSAEAVEMNLHVTIHSSRRIAEELGIRIDQKLAATKLTASREMDGNYDDMREASERLFSENESRKISLQKEIEDICQNEHQQLSLSFQMATQGGLHQEAMQMVKNIKDPRKFRSEAFQEELNENLYIRVAEHIGARESDLFAQTKTAYTRETEGMITDFETSNFATIIKPVTPPLELLEYAIKKSNLYPTLNPLLVDVDIKALDFSRCQAFYRYHLLPMSFGGGAAAGVARFLKPKKEETEKAAASLDSLENLRLGGEETFKFVESVKVSGLVKPAVLGVTAVTTTASATGGLGSLGLSAMATLSVSVLPVILIGGGIAAGALFGQKMLKSARLDRAIAAYKQEITSSLNAIMPISTSIITRLKKKVIDKTNTSVTVLQTAINDAVKQELDICKSVEEAPSLIILLERDKKTLEEIVAECLDVAREACFHVEEDPFDPSTTSAS